MSEDDEYSKPKYPTYYEAADGGRKSSRLASIAARGETARHELMKMTAPEQQEHKKKQQKLNEQQRQKEKEASMIALSFDDLYLRRSNTGMNNDQIRYWIDSVYGHIENWYRDCLSVPENQPRLEAAQADINFFVNSVLR